MYPWNYVHCFWLSNSWILMYLCTFPWEKVFISTSNFQNLTEHIHEWMPVFSCCPKRKCPIKAHLIYPPEKTAIQTSHFSVLEPDASNRDNLMHFRYWCLVKVPMINIFLVTFVKVSHIFSQLYFSVHWICIPKSNNLDLDASGHYKSSTTSRM